MTFTDYINYFTTAAANHKSLLHTVNDPHFYEIEIDDLINGQRFEGTGINMLLESYEAKPTDQLSDNIRKMLNGAFLILREADVGNIADRNLALDECFEIAEDMVSKMMNDTRSTKQSRSSYPYPINVESGSFRFQKAGPLLTNLFGWRVEFTINDTWKNGLQLDPSKWNNETKFNI